MTETVGFGIRQIACNLFHPFFGRVAGDAGSDDSSCLQLDHEQNVIGDESAPGEDLNGKEVHTCNHRHMGGDEIPPCGGLATLGSRGDAVPAKNVADGLIATTYRLPTANNKLCSSTS